MSYPNYAAIPPGLTPQLSDVTDQWMPVPSISRLLLNGTGIVTIDSRDAAGAVTGAAFTVTLAGAVNQIEFPYYGDGAVSIRGTFTGSASAKVI